MSLINHRLYGNLDLPKTFYTTVPQGKLFEPSFIGSCLSEAMDKVDADGQLSHVDYTEKLRPQQ